MILSQPTNRVVVVVVVVYSFTCQTKLSRRWPYARPDNRLKITPRDTGPPWFPGRSLPNTKSVHLFRCSWKERMTPTIREQKSRRSAFASFFFSCSRDRGDWAWLRWGGMGQIKSVGGTITSRLDGNNARRGWHSLPRTKELESPLNFFHHRRLLHWIKVTAWMLSINRIRLLESVICLDRIEMIYLVVWQNRSWRILEIWKYIMRSTRWRNFCIMIHWPYASTLS